MTANEVTLNGVVYVPKSSVKAPAKKKNNMNYVMVRTQSAWVFAWYLETRKWQEVTLRDARRMWYRDGAASLSQLATEWTTKPQNCKFPCEVDTVELLQAVEIIPITEIAKESIAKVAVWKQ